MHSAVSPGAGDGVVGCNGEAAVPVLCLVGVSPAVHAMSAPRDGGGGFMQAHLEDKGEYSSGHIGNDGGAEGSAGMALVQKGRA